MKYNQEISFFQEEEGKNPDLIESLNLEISDELITNYVLVIKMWLEKTVGFKQEKDFVIKIVGVNDIVKRTNVFFKVKLTDKTYALVLSLRQYILYERN